MIKINLLFPANDRRIIVQAIAEYFYWIAKKLAENEREYISKYPQFYEEDDND